VVQALLPPHRRQAVRYYYYYPPPPGLAGCPTPPCWDWTRNPARWTPPDQPSCAPACGHACASSWCCVAFWWRPNSSRGGWDRPTRQRNALQINEGEKQVFGLRLRRAGRRGIPRNGTITDRLADEPTEGKRRARVPYRRRGGGGIWSRGREDLRLARVQQQQQQEGELGGRAVRGKGTGAAGGRRWRRRRSDGDGGGGRAREPKLVRWHTAGRPGGTQVSE